MATIKGFQFYMAIIYSFFVLVMDFENIVNELIFIIGWLLMVCIAAIIWKKSTIDEKKAYIGDEFYKKYLHTDLFCENED